MQLGWEHMNFKQVIGLAIICVGISFIGYGIYARSHVSAARKEIHKMAKSKNRILKTVGQEIEERIGAYGKTSNWCFFVGVISLIAGAGVVYYTRGSRS
ncbi:MAG: hypothetical protein A3E80_04915 [Chlamydiae bacterium RIFCSPHIGHO2_12_FULL_49_9]|nr:MAG: hypothetical protein A3E80_04915 [Chlamydiae bacterium RIFCSPHIGHO2_12_FULL_49_9]